MCYDPLRFIQWFNDLVSAILKHFTTLRTTIVRRAFDDILTSLHVWRAMQVCHNRCFKKILSQRIDGRIHSMRFRLLRYAYHDALCRYVSWPGGLVSSCHPHGGQADELRFQGLSPALHADGASWPSVYSTRVPGRRFGSPGG